MVGLSTSLGAQQAALTNTKPSAEAAEAAKANQPKSNGAAEAVRTDASTAAYQLSANAQGVVVKAEQANVNPDAKNQAMAQEAAQGLVEFTTALHETKGPEDIQNASCKEYQEYPQIEEG